MNSLGSEQLPQAPKPVGLQIRQSRLLHFTLMFNIICNLCNFQITSTELGTSSICMQ